MTRISDSITDRLVEVELPEGSEVRHSFFKGRDGKTRAFARLPDRPGLCDYHGLLDYYRNTDAERGLSRG